MRRNSPASAASLTALVDLPEQIRGYGHVRERHAAAVAERRAALKADLDTARADAAA